MCRLQSGWDPELGFARDIGPPWWRWGEGWGASPLPWEEPWAGTSDAPKDRLLDRDGKSLDVGPNRSPLACLGDVQRKRRRSQGSPEPWEGYFHPMGCPAYATPAKCWGGGLVVGGSTEKFSWMLETRAKREVSGGPGPGGGVP